MEVARCFRYLEIYGFLLGRGLSSRTRCASWRIALVNDRLEGPFDEKLTRQYAIFPAMIDILSVTSSEEKF